MSSAAACLQRLVEGYITSDYGGLLRKKFIPSGGVRDSHSDAPFPYTVALDAAELLDHLPWFASNLQCESAPALRSAFPAEQLLLFIGEEVTRCLHRHMMSVCFGIAAFTDIQDSSDGDEEEDEAGWKMMGTVTGGGGMLVNLMAWVSLEVYRQFQRAAEERLQHRRGVGGESAPDGGVLSADHLRQLSRVSTYLEDSEAFVPQTSNGAAPAWYSLDDVEELMQGVYTAGCGAAEEDTDPFTRKRHFFRDFMSEEVLPCLDAAAQASTASVSLRATLRSFSSLLSCSSSGANDDVAVARYRFWSRCFSYLRGMEDCRMEGQHHDIDAGTGTTAALGPLDPEVLAPQLVSTLAVELAYSVLEPASVTASSASGSALPSYSTTVVNGNQGRQQAAVEDALACVFDAVHVVVSPFTGSRDSTVCDAYADVRVASEWRMPAVPSPLSYSAPLRRCLVLPGIAIAATQIVDTQQERRAPEYVMAAVGTAVSSPVGAMDSLCIKEEEMEAYNIAAHWAEPLTTPAASTNFFMHAGSPPSSTSSSSVCHLPSDALRPAELLLLLSDLSPTRSSHSSGASALSLWDVVRQEVEAVGHGLVLLLVQSQVSRHVAKAVESWGTANRLVLLLCAIGDWGMQQLSLRFHCHINSMATVAHGSRLRCVRGGRGGVGVVHLCSTKPSAAATAVHQQFLVVVGSCAAPSLTASVAGSEEAASLEPTVPQSMYYNDDSTSSSETPSGSSSDREKSPRNANSLLRPSNSIFHECDCPVSVPYVVASVFISAPTGILQQEIVYLFLSHWRRLLHQLLLPPCLSRQLPIYGGDGAAVVVLRHLTKQLRQPVLKMSPNADPRTGAALQGQSVVTNDSLLRRRVMEVLREALWSYLLRALQNGSTSLSTSDAWDCLQRWQDVQAEAGHGGLPSTLETGEVSRSWESLLAIHSCFSCIGRCLDRLCRTVHVGTRSSVLRIDSWDAMMEVAGGLPEVAFYPMVEML